MPYEVKARANRKEILDWLEVNVGPVKYFNEYWSAYGVGWEMLPHGMAYGSIFQEPGRFIIRIWDRDKALLAKLRWE